MLNNNYYEQGKEIINSILSEASYEGSSYSAEDEFEYREQKITMEEFEEKVNSIQRIPLK